MSHPTSQFAGSSVKPIRMVIRRDSIKMLTDRLKATFSGLTDREVKIVENKRDTRFSSKIFSIGYTDPIRTRNTPTRDALLLIG